MSDIHGHLKEFEEMLELINFSDDDFLYVIGDIVDKGPDPLELLFRLKSMKNVKCLLGNHDHMMYTFLKSQDENNYITTRGYCHNWLYGNDGDRTMLKYEKLGEDKQYEVYQFLSSLTVAIPDLKVGDKTFYLVHAMPEINLKKEITMSDVGDTLEDLERYIWERPREYHPFGYNWRKLNNKLVICGHTINRSHRITEVLSGLYDIDCGCAIDETLGCLRLDDMKEFYVSCSKNDSSL